MATISTNQRDYYNLYTGADVQQIGLGLMQPNIYASPEYQAKKISNLVMGMLSKTVYAGFDHSPVQLLLPIGYISAENNIIGLNLIYVPLDYRKAIMKYVLDSNDARIRSNQPIMIDWHSLARSIPAVRYITRKYKQVGLGVRETYPLVEIPEAIQERSPWENHWKTVKNQ